MRFVLLHLPHIIPSMIVIGVLGRLGWTVIEAPPVHLSDEEIVEWRKAKVERTYRRRVHRASARTGLIALPLLLVGFGTGLWLYTLALRDDRPGDALVWVHVATSVLGLALSLMHLSDLGWARIRRGLDIRRAFTDGVSLVLLVFGVPVLLSGIALVLEPSNDSTAAYVHLVTSVWWSVVFTVHVGRYLGRSVAAALRGKAAEDTPVSQVPQAPPTARVT